MDWSKQWNMLGWLDAQWRKVKAWKMFEWQYSAVEAAASEPDLLSSSLLQDIGPRRWLLPSTLLSFFQHNHQLCTDHRLTSLKGKVSTTHDFLQYRQLFWLRVWTWKNPPPPPDGLKNLMFQNFNLAIFRFPPPSQDIGPLLPWPILPLPPRSPALKVGRGEGRICGSLQQWWG